MYSFHYLETNQNSDIVGEVNGLLKGFFRVAFVSTGSESLNLYTDERDSPLAYSGEFTTDQIVSWVLS
jgi:hypothetical protein